MIHRWNEDLASFQAEWLPPGPGSYTIHAVAYGPDGAPSEYDETRITLGMDTPTPVVEIASNLDYPDPHRYPHPGS